MAPGDGLQTVGTGHVDTSAGSLTHAPAVVRFSSDPPVGPIDPPRVMSARQMQGLDETIAEAEQATGLRFAVYLGDLGADGRARAESLLDAFGSDAPYTVLLALSPGQRAVEVVTGTEAALRVSDRGARVAVLSVVASCGDGDIPGAITNGLRILADQAGPALVPSAW